MQKCFKSFLSQASYIYKLYFPLHEGFGNDTAITSCLSLSILKGFVVWSLACRRPTYWTSLSSHMQSTKQQCPHRLKRPDCCQDSLSAFMLSTVVFTLSMWLLICQQFSLMSAVCYDKQRLLCQHNWKVTTVQSSKWKNDKSTKNLFSFLIFCLESEVIFAVSHFC